MINKIKVYEPMSPPMLAIVNGINKLIDIINKGGGSVPRDLEVDTLTVKGDKNDLHISYYDQIEANNISTENYLTIESGRGIYMVGADIFSVDIVSDKHINPPIYIDKDIVIFNANGTSIAVQDGTYAKYFKNIKINYSNISQNNLTKQQVCQLLNITDKELNILCIGCEGVELINNNNRIYSNNYNIAKNNDTSRIYYYFNDILTDIMFLLDISVNIRQNTFNISLK